MGLIEKAEGWLFSVALKKAVARVVSLVVAVLVSVKVSGILAAWGITIDTTKMEASLTLFLVGALDMARNFLKVKYGVKGL